MERYSPTSVKTLRKPPLFLVHALVPMEIDEDAAMIYFATSKKQIMEVLEMRYIPVFERAG